MITLAKEYSAQPLVDDPYSSLITQFIAAEFPGIAFKGANQLIDVLTNIFVGSGQVRYGPAPSPESLVEIRNVLRIYTQLGKPVPVLVPWGGRKTVHDRSIDVADFVALKQIRCLQQAVQQHYQPGITVNIRIEDTGALYLYQDEGIKNDVAVAKYSGNLQTLVRVLNMHYVNPVRESTLLDEDAYFGLADQIQDAMFEYISESDGVGWNPDMKSWVRLQNLGWQGRIPKEQREYYRSRYRAAQPGISDFAATKKLAAYFAGSLARYQLNGTAAQKEWGQYYIHLSFVPPVPGAPEKLTNKNLYYRTVPEKFARTHIAPWRAYGYLALNGTAVPKLVGYNAIPANVVPHTTLLERAGEGVQLNTDYVIA